VKKLNRAGYAALIVIGAAQGHGSGPLSDTGGQAFESAGVFPIQEVQYYLFKQ
jgi:hypothetical protein